MAWLLFPVAILILVDLIVHALGIRLGLSLFDRSLPFAPRVGEVDPGAENFQFPSADGQVLLAGSLLACNRPAPRGVVIFCHELGGNRWTARHYCQGALSAGYHVVTFDFSGHCESESRHGYTLVKWLTEYDVDDVLGAVEFVRSQAEWANVPLFLFGVSKGAGAALSAAARTSLITGVIAEGAHSTRRLMSLHATRWLQLALGPCHLWFPRWRIDLSLDLIRRLSQLRHHCRYTHLERDLANLTPTPIFWMSGECDTYIKPVVVYELCEAAGGDPAGDVWIVDGARHNSARLQHQHEYDRRVAAFLDRSAASPPGAVSPSTVVARPLVPRQVASQHV